MRLKLKQVWSQPKHYMTWCETLVNVKTNWLGQELELNIEKVAHGGIFVARHEGRVLFVSHTLPGERVIAKVFEDKGGSFARAEAIQILEASADRVPHFWKNGEQAGGAEFGHISLERQRELKADVLEEGLLRFAGISLRVPVQAIDETGLGYRTRIQLQVDQTGQAGPYRERTHEIFRVKTLPLAVPEIQELGLHLKNWQQVKKIQVASSNTGGIQYLVDKKLKGDPTLVETVNGRTYRLSPGAFWQVHVNAPKVLSDEIMAVAKAAGFDKNADNLDLYSGVGLFTGSLVAAFGTDIKITLVESSKVATDDAKKNFADLAKLKTVATGVSSYLQKIDPLAPNSTVVIDPPRSGAGLEVIRELVRVSPRHIIYVACDPIALARDLKELTAAGYQIQKLTAFDLFPQTHHFETVVSLIR